MKKLLDDAHEDTMLLPDYVKSAEVKAIDPTQYLRRRRYINGVYGVKRLIREAPKLGQDISVIVLELGDFYISNHGFNPETDECNGNVVLQGDAEKIYDWCLERNLGPKIVYSKGGRPELLFVGVSQFVIVITW
ncbi:MAG: hypothetical protein Q7S19_00225 [bacterium]|nr:hypothetical protein [bacterium]